MTPQNDGTAWKHGEEGTHFNCKKHAGDACCGCKLREDCTFSGTAKTSAAYSGSGIEHYKPPLAENVWWDNHVDSIMEAAIKHGKRFWVEDRVLEIIREATRLGKLEAVEELERMVEETRLWKADKATDDLLSRLSAYKESLMKE